MISTILFILFLLNLTFIPTAGPSEWVVGTSGDVDFDIIEPRYCVGGSVVGIDHYRDTRNSGRRSPEQSRKVLDNIALLIDPPT